MTQQRNETISEPTEQTREKELAAANADQSYWQRIFEPLDYTVVGWTYRNTVQIKKNGAATFISLDKEQAEIVQKALAKSPSPTGDGEAGNRRLVDHGFDADSAEKWLLGYARYLRECEGYHNVADAMEQSVAALRSTQPPQGGKQSEEQKLVEFFNSPAGYSAFGWEGDQLGLSPAETAIRAMKASISPRPTGDEACQTCQGDPDICANVPGLRHCEAATRERPTGDADGLSEKEIVSIIYGQDMGPGVSLGTVLGRGMKNYYEAPEDGQAERSATWAITQVARAIIDRLSDALRSADRRLAEVEQKRTELQEAFDQHFHDQGEIAYVGIRDYAGMQSRAEAAEARVAELKKDAARLDWLDQVNANMNDRNRTIYGWRYDINHNRASLTDHNLPALKVREAIDEAMSRAALTGAGKGERG